MKITKLAPWLGAVTTGLLLAASFPPLQWQDAAWVALVPLFLAVRFLPPGDAFRLGFTAGGIAWLLSLSWLTHVSAVGWILLALYCALYTAPAAAFFSWWSRGQKKGAWTGNLLLVFLMPIVWAGLEYLRCTLFTGFAWNTLAISQYRNLAIIHLAAWGGAYAVSALVVCLNTALAVTVLQYVERRDRPFRRPHLELVTALLLLAAAFVTGIRSLGGGAEQGHALRVALIQPGIPQSEKWDAATADQIYERLETLTTTALRGGTGLDLIIWPETALPDDVRTGERSYDLVRGLATNGVPLLVGSMDTEWMDNRTARYFNSSFLFDENGAIAMGYDKRHLVMFGEYVPLERFLPFMNAMTPIEESFTPGATNTVFVLADPPVAFSVLICFEDTVAEMARLAVRNGARLLINQTNDAWFDPSSASRQHMAHCVLRCVENGVPAVRVGNTGVTCCIDRRGRIRPILEGSDGVTVFPGFLNAAVRVPGDQFEFTFYTRHGELFGKTAALLALGCLLAMWVSVRRATAVAPA